MMWFMCCYSNCELWLMSADAQTNYGVSSAHAQWFLHGKSRVDDRDIILWCHSDLLCYWGREVYKESKHEHHSCHLGFWN